MDALLRGNDIKVIYLTAKCRFVSDGWAKRYVKAE